MFLSRVASRAAGHRLQDHPARPSELRHKEPFPAQERRERLNSEAITDSAAKMPNTRTMPSRGLFVALDQ